MELLLLLLFRILEALLFSMRNREKRRITARRRRRRRNINPGDQRSNEFLWPAAPRAFRFDLSGLQQRFFGGKNLLQQLFSLVEFLFFFFNEEFKVLFYVSKELQSPSLHDNWTAELTDFFFF